jgi:antitoxin ParD1/3/4
MNVELTPELTQLIEGKVKSGRYRSATEVLQEALRLLEQRDTGRASSRNEVRSQIEEGWQSARRGELVDLDEVFDRIDAELALAERSTPG